MNTATMAFETFCGTSVIMLIGLFLFGAFAAFVVGARPSAPRRSRQIEKAPKRETYTEEEILSPGVDTRRSDARRQIETSRKAVTAKMTPAWADYRLKQKMAQNRKLFTDPDEVVEGEVVTPELQAGWKMLESGETRRSVHDKTFRESLREIREDWEG